MSLCLLIAAGIDEAVRYGVADICRAPTKELMCYLVFADSWRQCCSTAMALQGWAVYCIGNISYAAQRADVSLCLWQQLASMQQYSMASLGWAVYRIGQGMGKYME